MQGQPLGKRTWVSLLIILILIPLTIAFGVIYLEDRKYYFISLLIIVYTMIPFFVAFEQRKPQAREMVIIAVLTALAVAGRAVFFMVPQFKPVAAIVIITAVCFGAESGFLVGALAGFVSNFFFGQGSWTPWQMFSFGIIGFLAGILFTKGILKKTRLSLCIFGGLATFLLYGGIMNFNAMVMSSATISWQQYLGFVIAGLGHDSIHGIATVFFLFLLANPMIEKLERIKVKYGLMEPGREN